MILISQDKESAKENFNVLFYFENLPMFLFKYLFSCMLKHYSLKEFVFKFIC